MLKLIKNEMHNLAAAAEERKLHHHLKSVDGALQYLSVHFFSLDHDSIELRLSIRPFIKHSKSLFR
jgi:hypothetical protein